MGGEGAKERRRLKRLAATQGGGGGGDTTVEKKRVPFKRNDARGKSMSKHQFPKKNSFGSGAKPVGRFHKHNSPKNHGATSKTSFQTTKYKKQKNNKNKPKKPKHLKRKLEQLGDEEAEEREAVLKKLNEWERAKEKFSSQHKNEHNDYSATNKQQKNDNDLAAAGETKDFPRGGDIGDKEVNESPEVEVDETPVVQAEPDIVEKESMETEINNTSSEKAEDKGTNNDDDSDSDGDEPAEPRRQRGRRRRGRKDTAKQIAETAPVVEDSKPTPPAKDGGADAVAADEDEEKEESSTKTETKKPKDPSRYCAGRKPVTDFVVGQCYTGKVVYVKSFGVFIDIGCHSDAFCHVSRLSDDYVESPETLFKEGDELNPRIVEIDRKQKKITVSLQSEARFADEQKSIAARKERRESRKKSKPKPKYSTPKKDFGRDDFVRKAPASYEKSANPLPPAVEAPKPPKPTPILPPDESTMTPAELKRARKLARRAARREEAEAVTNQ